MLLTSDRGCRNETVRKSRGDGVRLARSPIDRIEPTLLLLRLTFVSQPKWTASSVLAGRYLESLLIRWKSSKNDRWKRRLSSLFGDGGSFAGELLSSVESEWFSEDPCPSKLLLVSIDGIWVSTLEEYKEVCGVLVEYGSEVIHRRSYRVKTFKGYDLYWFLQRQYGLNG